MTEGFEPAKADGSPLVRAGAAEKGVMKALTSALKVSRLHTLDNVVCRTALEDFHNTLDQYLSKADGRMAILIGEGLLYVNSAMVQKPRTGRSWIDEFIEFMERAGLAGIRFGGTWHYEAVESLIEAFRQVKAGEEEAFETLKQSLVTAIERPAEIEVYDEVHVGGGVDGSLEVSDAALATYHYARLVSLMQAAHASVREDGGSPDVQGRLVRQTIYKVVEGLTARVYEMRMVALTASPPSPEDPLATHAANICLLSILCGRLLGLGRGALSNLGYAALFHDVGRAVSGRDRSKGPTSPQDEQHVILGVRTCLRGQTTGDANLLRLIVVQEHHRVADGYPSPGRFRLSEPHLYSKIVAVCNAFDELQEGAWGAALGPAAALRALEEEPERYPEALVGVLRSVLGPYPRGTLLRLKDRSTAVVLEGGAIRSETPIVRVVLDSTLR